MNALSSGALRRAFPLLKVAASNIKFTPYFRLVLLGSHFKCNSTRFCSFLCSRVCDGLLVMFQMLIVPSMWFWSVSWSTNCSVFFSFGQLQKKLSSLREFLVSLWEFLVEQISFWYTKTFFGSPNFFFGLPKIPRDCPKIPWDWTIFFGWPKKMRKRPDNWSTKRLTKTTWTGLI